MRNDECGFSLQQEVLKKGAPVRLEFQNHVYALLVTRGSGRVRLLDVGKGQTQDVSEGSLVALNAAEAVEIEATSDELHAVSVMNPPVFGVEKRSPTTGVFPAVDLTERSSRASTSPVWTGCSRRPSRSRAVAPQ